MTFAAENRAFEAWLKTQCAVVASDLDVKHERMRKDAFNFLRATCFSWSGKIEKLLPELAMGPSILSVGDCHSENFGTWRDSESRLVWGVNDFDEAALMPYAFDLVRLAASVRLAPRLGVTASDAAAAILEGYTQGLEHPLPTLLDDADASNLWMREHIAVPDQKRQAFWAELNALRKETPPNDLEALLRQSLPEGAEIEKFARRPRQGEGSLGRPRYVVIARLRGGRVVREAKALVASAWDYAHGKANGQMQVLQLARGRYRSPDPFLTLAGGFIIRRIWPDSRKVDLGEEAGKKLSTKLQMAMGRDLGAVHAGAVKAVPAVRKDLAKQPQDWLHQAAKRAAGMVTADYEEWCGAKR